MFILIFLSMEWYIPFIWIGLIALMVFGIKASIENEKTKTQIRRSNWQYKRVARLKIGATLEETKHQLRYCKLVDEGNNSQGKVMIYHYDSVSSNLGSYKHRSYSIYSNYVFLQFNKYNILTEKIMNFDMSTLQTNEN